MDQAMMMSGDERFLPFLRDDLHLLPGPPAESGAPSWSIHDQVRNTFFRLGWLEFELLVRWSTPKNGQVTAAQLAERVNRETTISPLHGAVIVASLLNGGRMVVPSVVDRISDPSGRVLYRHEASKMDQAVAQATSRALTDMMTATISRGTARKAFRGYRKDKVLSRLTIGGKTGSIYNKEGNARFDWFVGFAEDRDGKERIAVSVVVAHEEYIGIRASQYARMLMRKHFGAIFERSKDECRSKNGATPKHRVSYVLERPGLFGQRRRDSGQLRGRPTAGRSAATGRYPR